MCQNRIKFLNSHTGNIDRPPSIFDTTLSPNLEKDQYTPPINCLAADAFAFFMAATDTSGNVMVTALYNLLAGPPQMLAQLKDELREAISERDSIVTWAKLEELPYLVNFTSSSPGVRVAS